MRVCFCTFFILFKPFVIHSLNVTDLGGQWTVEDASKKYINLTATVPGGIYLDLMNNNIIGDILYGTNDTETRWVAQTNWTYTKNFIVDDALMTHEMINLVFEGLDTFATIFINDAEIGNAENMFRRYIFDVKDILKLGSNTVEVRFLSPITMAKEMVSKQDYVIPPECPPDVYHGECHVNQIRKMQASFAWDWGPAFPSMGIWKDVYLEAFNSSVVRYVLFNVQEEENDLWSINVTTYLSAKNGRSIQGKLLHTLETDVNSVQQIVTVNRTVEDDSNEIKINISFTIPKISVRLWWPNGYGDQKLYKLTTEFKTSTESDSRNIRVGFRKIELLQEPIGSGLSFYFKVNNVPIFAKGANEIPLDLLPEKGQDPSKISKILQSAHDSNMNMLRVWGGGVYESDFFYEKTDELGILVWQDFMFACAMYPTHVEFLKNVREEVRHQVRRLQRHPSVALWAANNENELALMTNWFGVANLTRYKKDYVELYIDTIRAELFELSEVIFLSSSPTNGKRSEDEGFLAPDPGNPLFGDVHYYNYILDSLNTLTYPIPRFVSEYGYQSLPDVDTWLTVTDNSSNLNPASNFMDHRQHHPLGLIENTLLISYQLHLNDSIPNYPKTYIFYSQIIQAMSIKFETEYYRSLMGRTDQSGRGNTMGALYWQLNDVWVAPTWSGIDYTGKWKMLQYYARDFFAQTIITGFLDITRELDVYIVSEVPSLMNSQIEVSAVIDVYNWNSFSPLNSSVLNVTLDYGRSNTVASIQSDAYLEAVGCGTLSQAKSNCFFYLTLMAGNTVIAPRNWVVTTALKYSNLNRTIVIVGSVVQIDDEGKKFEITTSATGISLFVWLDSHRIEGKFAENGFLQVTPSKNVMFEAESATSVQELKGVITVVHLNHQEYQG